MTRDQMLELLKEDRIIYEDQNLEHEPDPDETPVQDRRLITQPYDLVISAMLKQITDRTLHLRPISDRPSFQRRYVWPDKLASKLIESILLSVPIPPCYLSQNEDYELDVIDGQQRIYSIFRYCDNQFKLSNLEVLKELNGMRYFQLPTRLRRKLDTFTLRLVIISNDSDPEIRFDVFERLNSNTVPLNAQELRNCIHRGALIDLVNRLAEYEPWLVILHRKQPDVRMRGEELILRFFAFYCEGLASYRTPQKHWLNDAAKEGRKYSEDRINELETVWKASLDKSMMIFKPNECFRRLPLEKPRAVINRALMDLTLTSLADIPSQEILRIGPEFRRRYMKVLQNRDFEDLITRAIDHKSRTLKRFETWQEQVVQGL